MPVRAIVGWPLADVALDRLLCAKAAFFHGVIVSCVASFQCRNRVLHARLTRRRDLLLFSFCLCLPCLLLVTLVASLDSCI